MSVIQEQFSLLAFGLVFIGVRMFVRCQQVGWHWALDDYLMPLTGIVFTSEVVAAYLVGAEFQGLTNSYITDEERAALDPSSREYFNRQWGSKIQVIGWSFYALILWLLKFCITAFYSRLTSGVAHLRLRVYIAYGLLSVTYLAVALTLVLSCQPMSKFWQINPHPGSLCTPTNSPAYVLVVVIPNVLTDAYLLSIPLPLLWGVNISLRRRLTLMLLFSGALFIMMAGTIRAVVISTSGPEGAVSGSSWACRETFVAIIVTNLPIIQPLIRRGANKIGLTSLFSRSGQSRGESHQLRSTDKNIMTIGGGVLSSNGTKLNTSAKRKSKIPGPHTAAWASDEEILPRGSMTAGAVVMVGEGGKGGGSGKETGIVVAQEVRVHSEVLEEVSSGVSDASRNDWGYNTTAQKGHGRF